MSKEKTSSFEIPCSIFDVQIVKGPFFTPNPEPAHQISKLNPEYSI